MRRGEGTIDRPFRRNNGGPPRCVCCGYANGCWFDRGMWRRFVDWMKGAAA